MALELVGTLLQVVDEAATNHYPPTDAPTISRSGPALAEALAGQEAVTTTARDGTKTTVYRAHRAFVKVTVPPNTVPASVTVSLTIGLASTDRVPNLLMSVVATADYGATQPRVLIPVPTTGVADVTVQLPLSMVASFQAALSARDVWLQFATDQEADHLAPATPNGANYELVQPIRSVRVTIIQRLLVTIGDTVGVSDSVSSHTVATVQVEDRVTVADTVAASLPYVPQDVAGVHDEVHAVWTVKIDDHIGVAESVLDVTDEGHRVNLPILVNMPTRSVQLYLSDHEGVIPVLRFKVGNAPFLRPQVLEEGEQPNTWIAPDISGWTGYLTLTPRDLRVPRIAGACYLADVGAGIFGFDIQGGVLPMETPPLVAPDNSFSQPATYDGVLDVVTASGETLTTSPFIVQVDPR